MLAWAGIVLGGWLVTAYMSGRPFLSAVVLGTAVALFLLLLTYPVIGWWLFIAAISILVGSLVLYVVWAMLPFLLGAALGVAILFLLIMTLPMFLRSIGL